MKSQINFASCVMLMVTRSRTCGTNDETRAERSLDILVEFDARRVPRLSGVFSVSPQTDFALLGARTTDTHGSRFTVTRVARGDAETLPSTYRPHTKVATLVPLSSLDCARRPGPA